MGQDDKQNAHDLGVGSLICSHRYTSASMTDIVGFHAVLFPCRPHFYTPSKLALLHRVSGEDTIGRYRLLPRASTGPASKDDVLWCIEPQDHSCMAG